MTDRPIIFSAPMIRALLDGRKTHTRLVLKPQPDPPPGFDGWAGFSALCPHRHYEMRGYDPERGPLMRHRPLPYWNGDRLWVRESFSHTGAGLWDICAGRLAGYGKGNPVYRADGGDGPWWPSIHMPREFSRLTLIVGSIKIERLQSISEEDARREGIFDRHACGDDPTSAAWTWSSDGWRYETPREAFKALWGSINGNDAWEQNPWVVAICFRTIKANIDAL